MGPNTAKSDPGPVVVLASDGREVDQVLKRGVLEAGARDSELHFMHTHREQQRAVTWILRRRGHRRYTGAMSLGDSEVDLASLVFHCNQIGASLLIVAGSIVHPLDANEVDVIEHLACDLLVLPVA